jgi:RimJ/RimL family protein N-acetyltransferase
MLAREKLVTTTPRLLLRPFRMSDYPVWLAAKQSLLPRRTRFDRDPPTPKELTRTAFARWLKTKHRLQARDLLYVFGVFDRKSGALVGQVSLLTIGRHRLQIASLGYETHNAHWGKGYGKEAARAMMLFAFKSLRFHRVEAGAEPANRASIAVARGIGMKPEGLKRGYVFNGERWLDLKTFGAVAEDFGVKTKKPSIRAELGD